MKVSGISPSMKKERMMPTTIFKSRNTALSNRAELVNCVKIENERQGSAEQAQIGNGQEGCKGKGLKPGRSLA